MTAFPSALAAAASWDPSLVFRWAAAIGAEFRAKGANVVLGPSVNVHRIPRGGRNGEYLSGEDPALGVPLADAYVCTWHPVKRAFASPITFACDGPHIRALDTRPGISRACVYGRVCTGAWRAVDGRGSSREALGAEQSGDQSQ